MPRTLAENAQYIAETIKPAIKSAIEAQGVTVPSTDSFLDYADRIGEIEGGGSGYQLKDLPTGAISTVNDAAPLPLNALKVSVEAWQEGSGDPSPSNVRPIHGWDSGEITVCDDIENPTQTETTTLDFPQTIYGAEWDVVNGEFDNQYGAIDLESFTWVYDANKICWNIGILAEWNMKGVSNNQQVANAIAEQFKIRKASGMSTSVAGELAVDVSMLRANTGSDSEAPKGLLKYELATPTIIPLSPLSIRLLEGTNNIYADCGDIIDGEYFVDEGAIDVRKVDYSIGSNSALKISDGRIMQGFVNMSNYGIFPRDASNNWLDVDWSKDFEIGVAFKFTALPTSNYAMLFGAGTSGGTNYRNTPRLYYDASASKLLLNVFTASGDLTPTIDYTLSADTWYHVILKFTASTLAVEVKISTDFSTYTTIYSATASAVPIHNSAMLIFGGDANGSNFSSNNLLIDTFNTYIKGDGVNWGAFTGAFPS